MDKEQLQAIKERSAKIAQSGPSVLDGDLPPEAYVGSALALIWALACEVEKLCIVLEESS